MVSDHAYGFGAPAATITGGAPSAHAPAFNSKILNALLEDDRDYFRAGAETIAGTGWRILLMRGLSGIAATCVLEFDDIAPQIVAAAIDGLRRENISFARFYLPGLTHPAFLAKLGFRQTIELALVKILPPVQTPIDDSFTLRRALPEDDTLKTEMFARDSGRPDGKASAPELYVELERRKIDDGYMTGYIVEFEGEPAACFGFGVQNGVGRLKNVFTDPRKRRIGCGAAIVRFGEQQARARGLEAIGTFSFTDSPGQRLYMREGMIAFGAHTEFYSPLEKLEQAARDL
ncbi:MAG: GNAT family N-acetyltransferase [Pseudomonadota bacterium]